MGHERQSDDPRLFYARHLAVLAGIILFGFNGWFTGMQNALFPMMTAITVNLDPHPLQPVVRIRAGPGIVGIA